jgi:uncharacterized protein (DUF697 family)
MTQSSSTQPETTAAELSQTIGKLFEEATKGAGEVVEAITEHPLLGWFTHIPGANRLVAFLGKVDVAPIAAEVARLQSQYPLDSQRQIAERMIQKSAFQAGTVGLLTNLAPPLALTLFTVDLAAMSRLQAEMVYRIAAAYGFSLTDPTRRGEVLAIFGLSMLGSGALKTGASFVELLPAVGAVSGAAVNATLLFGLGQTAIQFYESKKQPASKAVVVVEPM